MDVDLASVRFREHPVVHFFFIKQRVKDYIVHGNVSLLVSLRLPEIFGPDQYLPGAEIDVFPFQVRELSDPHPRA